MESFAISGKAKEVFRWLELRAYYNTRQRINELNNMKTKQQFPLLGGVTLLVDKDGDHICPLNPEWHCNVDDHETCAKAKCEPWVNKFKGLT